MFNYFVGSPICPNCKQQDEEDFKKIKEYLYKNPKAPMGQVSEDCDVSVERIERFLKEGRLIPVEGSDLGVQCEKCGQNIKTGRLCDSCAKSLETQFSKVGEEERKKVEEGNTHKSGMKYIKYED
jgi:hypothetical protein